MIFADYYSYFLIVAAKWRRPAVNELERCRTLCQKVLTCLSPKNALQPIYYDIAEVLWLPWQPLPWRYLPGMTSKPVRQLHHYQQVREPYWLHTTMNDLRLMTYYLRHNTYCFTAAALFKRHIKLLVTKLTVYSCITFCILRLVDINPGVSWLPTHQDLTKI